MKVTQANERAVILGAYSIVSILVLKNSPTNFSLIKTCQRSFLERRTDSEGRRRFGREYEIEHDGRAVIFGPDPYGLQPRGSP